MNIYLSAKLESVSDRLRRSVDTDLVRDDSGDGQFVTFFFGGVI